MDTRPQVTCIMPTYNRRRFVPRAVEYFLRQDYGPCELLVVDDGSDPVGDLMPPDRRVRYIRLPSRTSIGAKRNLACEQSRGDIILHWDDDDWHSPRRVRYQVETLLAERADVCGISRIIFYDARDQSAWIYAYPPTERFWLYGNSLCYRREFWQRNRFADVNVGEDTQFIWNADGARMVTLHDSTFHVSIMHGDNVSARATDGPYWQRDDANAVREILGSDTAFYEKPTAIQLSQPRDLRMTGALDTDLRLPEFVAFRDRQALPHMRTWELPYALFAARLRDTAAVLDCTINPCGFGERIARLYPHVLYRSVPPVQHGCFVLPAGVPDAAFDCAFCINTLEHLLPSQREALVAEIATRLQPGGRLVLTSDYYFDSFWTSPDILATGLVRADGSGVFNGFNKVTARDWVALCAPHGLRPLAAPQEDPREDDVALFRNRLPYPHACIGGVFVKGDDSLACSPRTVVLAMLTWNTCAVTMDSVHAYVREAAMLARVGHRPIICICDNGSDDGTREALRAFERGLEVPHQFIYNNENRGSSVARNQMIAFALQAGADYLLLTDGDVEAVPFSSMAMLRYMESSGRWLGCLGADSSAHSTDRGRVSTCLYSVADCRILSTALVAWTQYGMFRMQMFKEGIRFDEGGPFGGPGWGFEDNDLSFQMAAKGYRNEYFAGMTYLHRAARSSVRNLRRIGMDPTALFVSRKNYLVGKWSGVAPIEGTVLDHIRRMPHLV
jgi:glycosyltransferase involved in cell wall biosynthesis